jgi:hypothetical protein
MEHESSHPRGGSTPAITSAPLLLTDQGSADVFSESALCNDENQDTGEPTIMGIQPDTERGRLSTDGAAQKAKRMVTNLAGALARPFQGGADKSSPSAMPAQTGDAVTEDVELASEDSFPASDPPAWTSTGVKHG